ncbi:MAG: hypothetical protein J6A11_02345 [Lachnospiraceae bacterium]|nr:hypothetical protein [Lachnospiraceae bacterium]
MIEPIFYAGIIISLTWMIATLIVKEKKRKILMTLGVVACLVLLLYTRQWKLFEYGIIGGLLFGSVGIGYRQDKLRELQKENGIVQTMMIWVIALVLFLMFLAVSTPDMNWGINM